MTRFLPRLCLPLAALALAACLAGAAGAGLTVGVNDDAALDPTTVGWFYPTMGAEGLQISTRSTCAGTTRSRRRSRPGGRDRGDRRREGERPDRRARPLPAALDGLHRRRALRALDRSAGAAATPPRSRRSPPGRRQVASAFPTVHQFVVMNECNQPLFVNPQFDHSGANQSAEICGRALVASYDALKAVSAAELRLGRRPLAARQRQPERRQQRLDLAGRLPAGSRRLVQGLRRRDRPDEAADGRARLPPLPDPAVAAVRDRATPTRRARRVSNLPRIYQAFYNGFNGSPQPTIGQQAGGGLPVSLNEVGIQTDSTGQSGYSGTEVSANAAGGVLGQTATEAYQASWYLQMLQLLACDPNVRIVNIYHLIDEADLAGWQSGLYYVDRTAKQSAATVHDWIASTGGACQGALQPVDARRRPGRSRSRRRSRRPRAGRASSSARPAGSASTTRPPTSCGGCWRRSGRATPGRSRSRSATSTATASQTSPPARARAAGHSSRS